MRLEWTDVFAPPLVALVVLLLGWSATRAINGGRPLTSIQRNMGWFVPLFILGCGYSMMIVGAFHWPHWTWIPPSAAWAAVLGLVAWRRHRQRHSRG
jgi:hypothetical protein